MFKYLTRKKKKSTERGPDKTKKHKIAQKA